MGYLANLVGTLCVLVAAMGFLYNLCAFPAMEKVVKLVIVIYIIVSVLKTAADEKISFKYDCDFDSNTGYKSMDEDFNKMLIEQTQTDMEKLISQRLNEKNISYNSVNVHILEQNNLLSIAKVIVICDNIHTQNVKESIEDLLSENTEVIIGDTDCEN